jgi:hypothetical protein
LGKRGPPPEKMALLFRLKYLQQIEDREKLTEKLGITKDSLRVYESRLHTKLVNSLKQVSPERLRLICPECLETSVWKDPENGERVCTKCGHVVEQQPDMIHRLPFDETYALESGLAFNRSLGVADTVRRRYGYTKILAKTRNNVSKIKFVEEILERWKSGGTAALEAAEKIREVLVKGGAEEIAKTILERKSEKPAELAKRIINTFDAIPTRQIMTLHEEYDPPLLRKMKEYGNQLLQDAWEALSRFCDPIMFGHSYGAVIEKVGSAALMDPDMKHSPKDLAAACFVTSLFQINPDANVPLSYPPSHDVQIYVSMVTSPLRNEKLAWKGGEKDWRKT